MLLHAWHALKQPMLQLLLRDLQRRPAGAYPEHAAAATST